jgi:hypothetical protein
MLSQRQEPDRSLAQKGANLVVVAPQQRFNKLCRTVAAANPKDVRRRPKQQTSREVILIFGHKDEAPGLSVLPDLIVVRSLPSKLPDMS